MMVKLSDNVLALLVNDRVALDALADALTQFVQNGEDIEDELKGDAGGPGLVCAASAANELAKLNAARKMRDAVDAIYCSMAEEPNVGVK